MERSKLTGNIKSALVNPLGFAETIELEGDFSKGANNSFRLAFLQPHFLSRPFSALAEVGLCKMRLCVVVCPRFVCAWLVCACVHACVCVLCRLELCVLALRVYFACRNVQRNVNCMMMNMFVASLRFAACSGMPTRQSSAHPSIKHSLSSQMMNSWNSLRAGPPTFHNSSRIVANVDVNKPPPE